MSRNVKAYPVDDGHLETQEKLQDELRRKKRKVKMPSLRVINHQYKKNGSGQVREKPYLRKRF